jgi:hypothetical protein
MSREERYLDEFPDEAIMAAGRDSGSAPECRVTFTTAATTARTLGRWASRNEDITLDPFFEPGSVRAVLYAYSEGLSGSPRWAEPLATVDFFGKPTVFGKKFDPCDR